MPRQCNVAQVRAVMWHTPSAPDTSTSTNSHADRAGPRAPRHNLPAQPTSFVGREREVAEVARLLDSARLVTLTGSGGIGKTRLALEVAAELLETFPDGVWLVELAALADGPLAQEPDHQRLASPCRDYFCRAEPLDQILWQFQDDGVAGHLQLRDDLLPSFCATLAGQSRQLAGGRPLAHPGARAQPAVAPRTA